MLDVTIETGQGVPVLRLIGRLDGSGATVLESRAGEIACSQGRHWVLDFREVSYLSSAGISALLIIEKGLRERGGSVVLTGLSPSVSAILEMTGLMRQFVVASSPEEAQAIAMRREDPGRWRQHHGATGLDLSFELLPEPGSILDLWTGAERPGEPGPALVEASLADLQLSFGTGALGGSRTDARHSLGELVTTGRVAFVVPADGQQTPDYLLSDRPAETFVFAHSVVALTGTPHAVIKVSPGRPRTLENIVEELFALAPQLGQQEPDILAMVGLVTPDLLVHRPATTLPELLRGQGGRETLAAGSALITAVSAESRRPEGAEALPEILTGAERISGGERLLHAHAVVFAGAPELPADIELVTALEAAAGLLPPLAVCHLSPETTITSGTFWLFLPRACRHGSERGLQIEAPEEAALQEDWDLIIRRIYKGAGKVILSPLHGGFSASTFQVTSYDRDGTRLLPTVLKLGTADNITREEEACRNYVQRYILNNGTVVLGSARQGEWAGLSYNFVGVSGPESRLGWLRDHYLARPVEEVLPLFDRIFTDILKPWYGQPRWEKVFPYVDHVPPVAFFPHLWEDAERELGIPTNAETVQCPPLGLTLPNPYRVLRDVYPDRRSRSLLWYTAICHGDLNLQNILLDERENVYIIDFSETRPRNIVADFARLEAILLVELTRLENQDDLEALLPLALSLARANPLQATPELEYRGSDPGVAKAHAVISRLREYARTVTIFESNPVPYWLAVLQWTLPVVAYWSLTPLRKRFSLYSAALLCDSVLAADP